MCANDPSTAPEVAGTMIRNLSDRVASAILTPQLLVTRSSVPLATFHQNGGHCPQPSLTVSLESLASLPKGGHMTRRHALRRSCVTHQR